MYNAFKAKESELTQEELDYTAKLNKAEHKVYTADYDQLVKLYGIRDPAVQGFIEVSLLYDKLQKMHDTYNNNIEKYVLQPLLKDVDDCVYDMINERFSCSIQCGGYMLNIHCIAMDDCEAVYALLSTLKMNRFNDLVDDCQIDMLASII